MKKELALGIIVTIMIIAAIGESVLFLHIGSWTGFTHKMST
jgi:hypothetical protein